MTRHWFPHGAREQFERPGVGSLVATRRAVFRVVEYRPYYEDQWTDQERERVQRRGPEYAPCHIILRPPHIKGDDPRVRDFDESYSIRDPGRMNWWVYPDEHYPLCGTCGEPSPCREREAGRETDMALRWMARFEDPAKCPGCLKTVTTRARRLTLPNVIVPLGEPVTFHLSRDRCMGEARDYERRLAEVDPTYNPTLSCSGHVDIHADWQVCTRSESCPGQVSHRSMARCACAWGRPCPERDTSSNPSPQPGDSPQATP